MGRLFWLDEHEQVAMETSRSELAKHQITGFSRASEEGCRVEEDLRTPSSCRPSKSALAALWRIP